jgi:hypothetical protein
MEMSFCALAHARVSAFNCGINTRTFGITIMCQWDLAELKMNLKTAETRIELLEKVLREKKLWTDGNF